MSIYIISLLILFLVVLFFALVFAIAVRVIGWALRERETEWPTNSP
jgi:hypothetical protein